MSSRTEVNVIRRSVDRILQVRARCKKFSDRRARCRSQHWQDRYLWLEMEEMKSLLYELTTDLGMLLEYLDPPASVRRAAAEAKARAEASGASK